MSLSLALYFDESGLADDVYGFNVLRLQAQREEILMALRDCGVPLQRKFFRMDEEKGLTEEATDAYGRPLTVAPAHVVAARLAGAKLSLWDAAVLQFVEHLPPDTRIVLWWN